VKYVSGYEPNCVLLVAVLLLVVLLVVVVETYVLVVN
jgi:hypothetical protein